MSLRLFGPEHFSDGNEDGDDRTAAGRMGSSSPPVLAQPWSPGMGAGQAGVSGLWYS